MSHAPVAERADAYFVSCANIRAIDALDEMEDMLNRPVLTSNQVVLWQALRLAAMRWVNIRETWYERTRRRARVLTQAGEYLRALV